MWVHDQERAHAPRLASQRRSDHHGPSSQFSWLRGSSAHRSHCHPGLVCHQGLVCHPVWCALSSATAAPVAAAPAQLPRSVLAAAIIEAVEAVGVLVASVLAAVATVDGHSYQRASGIAITAIGIATAIALALVARALRAGRRWSRTPAMLTQLFTGIVAIYVIQSGRLDWGVPAIVLAIAGLAALLTPASIEVLTPGRIRKS